VRIGGGGGGGGGYVSPYLRAKLCVLLLGQIPIYKRSAKCVNVVVHLWHTRNKDISRWGEANREAVRHV
jgi:hypothetical protein